MGITLMKNCIQKQNFGLISKITVHVSGILKRMLMVDRCAVSAHFSNFVYAFIHCIRGAFKGGFVPPPPRSKFHIFFTNLL